MSFVSFVQKCITLKFISDPREVIAIGLSENPLMIPSDLTRLSVSKVPKNFIRLEAGITSILFIDLVRLSTL